AGGRGRRAVADPARRARRHQQTGAGRGRTDLPRQRIPCQQRRPGGVRGRRRRRALRRSAAGAAAPAHGGPRGQGDAADEVAGAAGKVRETRADTRMAVMAALVLHAVLFALMFAGMWWTRRAVPVSAAGPVIEADLVDPDALAAPLRRAL